jgi:ATP-dependent Clp protease ATP-binding subunit ClpA
VFERFTERARQVVVLAQDEARALKHNYIGTEHILLGLLREQEGLAARVLESFDVTVEEVRAQVARIVGQGDEVTTGQIPFTPRAKNVLELSLREALSLRHEYIGTEHILLGVARDHEGLAARILRDFDADAERIRNEVVRRLSAPEEIQASLPFEAETPPIAPEVALELDRLREERERAIEAQDLERAAAVHERERRLVASSRRLMADWKDEPTAVAAPAPWPHATPVPVRARGHPRRRVWQAESLLVGWTLFGVAAGLGVLVGRLIWG